MHEHTGRSVNGLPGDANHKGERLAESREKGTAMLFGFNRVLREEAGDGNGDGGGANTPANMTPEEVGKMINSALTSHLKRLNIDGKIDEKFGALNTQLTELGAKLTATPQVDPAGGDKGDKGKPGNVDPAIQKQLETLSSQLETEKAARVAAEQATTAEKQQREFDTAKQSLATGLKSVAHPDLHEDWVDLLVFKQRLKVEEGVPMLAVDHAPVKGMPLQREFLPLTEALPHLLKAEESKRFQAAPLPQKQNGGGGPRKGDLQSLQNSTNPFDRAEALVRQHGGSSLAEALES